MLSTLGIEFELTDDNKKGYQICSAAWSNNSDILVFGTEDSNIAVFTYRESTLEYKCMINIPPKNENAEIEGVAYLRFSEDSKLLAAAHMDSNLYIYSVNLDNGKLNVWPPLAHVASSRICSSSKRKLFTTIRSHCNE